MSKLSSLGNNARSYDVVEGWAKLPDHLQFGYTHGIEVDQYDNVYVFHTGKPSIAKFDKEGNFIAAWGEEFEGGAHGFYLHKEQDGEYLYITDTSKCNVVKMDLNGKHLLDLGTPDRPDLYDADKKYVPTDVAVASNGDIYAADGYGQSWIHQYNAAGEYKGSWGGPSGKELGKLNSPHGISINTRGGVEEIYIADRGNNRIQVFTLDGEFKRVIVDDMDMPCSFYFHGEDVYFPDLKSRVTIFDKDDRLICHLGEDQQAHRQEGWPNLPKPYYRGNKFSSPHGLCVDSTGAVYLAEWIFDGRVTKLVRV